MPKPSLSVVSTLYYSQDYIVEFYERILKCIREIGFEDYEIIFVDDGSPDNSLKVAVSLHEKDKHIKVIELSRNFGHHKAMMTGLSHAKNDFVFLIDVDLEEEPELLLTFWKELNKPENSDADVIYGVQGKRKGGWFERWSGEVFYRTFDYLADIKHPRNLITARILKHHYVEALLMHEEREIVISCLWAITGFKQVECAVKKHKRNGTSYSLTKKISHAVNAITSFSAAPLKFIFYTGFSIFSFSLFYSIYIVYRKLFHHQSVDGWTSLIVSIWMLSGLTILFIGVIGIYLSKIFAETKRRPNFIVKRKYES